MGDYAMAYILIGVIGLILLFCFLKMHEYLKQINEKMDTIISAMNDVSKSFNDKADKVVDGMVEANRSINEIKRKQNG